MDLTPPRVRASLIRDPQNFAAGLVLIGFAVVGWLGTSDLDVGRLTAMGPGLVPRFLVVCLTCFGLFMCVNACFQDGARIELADFSGVLVILALGAAALGIASLLPQAPFGWPAVGFVFCVLYLALMVVLVILAARRSTFLDRSGLRGPVFVIGGIIAFALTVRSAGLLVAGPLLAIISGAAASDTRFGELILYAIGMTLVSIGLFRYLLQLPMPVLVIPGVLYL
ncbi:tripartite tricarboxylate transporter TctB family protein [Xanthobacter sp. V3C-3]|uniref:tripartite tricarboxylate transporter TctB family protein n=1 Tax=Xanthobacter lutulentifluminis TaxID=3119935 RepID=UPI003728FC87